MFEFRYSLSLDDYLAFISSRTKKNKPLLIFLFIAAFMLVFLSFSVNSVRLWVFAIFYTLLFFLPLLYRWISYKSYTNSPFIGETQITFTDDKIIKIMASVVIEKTYDEIIGIEERNGNMYIISKHQFYSDIIPVALLKKMGKRQALRDFLEKKISK